MRRAELLLIVLGAAAACRGDPDEVAIPGTAPTPHALDAGAGDAGSTADAFGVRPLGTQAPPGSGGIAVTLPGSGASCPDPVVGVWVAKTYADVPRRWHEHRLSIRRGADDELYADQTTRIWNGGPDDGLPPLCPEGGPSWGIYHIDDRARFVDGILHVWGLVEQSKSHSCEGDVLDYNLDSFTGRVHRDSYVARNNDGSDAVNRPYHFRRITCVPD